MSQRFAIVGGGAAALSMLDALLYWCAESKPQIDGYGGSSAKTPRGVACGITSPRHLLNVRAGGIALLPAHRDDIVDFAPQTLPDARGLHYVPRAVYGDFAAGARSSCRARGGARAITSLRSSSISCC